MLSNTDESKYSLKADKISLAGEDEEQMKYADENASQKTLQEIANTSDAKSNAKNKVLELARVRNNQSSQCHVISSQHKPDLYRIAFDATIDDELENTNANNTNHMNNNCFSTIYGVISSNDVYNDTVLPIRRPRTDHIYVNQLSLAEEFELLNEKDNNSLSAINNCDISVDQMRNKCADNIYIGDGVSDCDSDLLPQPSRTTECKSAMADFNENFSQKTDSEICRKTQSSSDTKRVKIAPSVQRFLVNPNPVSNARDCLCCTVM